jgi:hypothetical protein
MSSKQSWTEQDLRAALDAYEAELRAAGKARNTITTYVQHPERFINWLVGSYKPRPTPAFARSDAGPDREHGGAVWDSKYEPLRAYLAARPDTDVVHLTFTEIESILGVGLPMSARRYRPWWANEQAGTHIHARAWLEAGYKSTNVDLAAGTIDFVRSA